MEFQNRIKDLRKKLRITQEELANRLHVSFATVNRWEQGKTQPRANQLEEIYNLCNQSNICFETSKNIIGIKIITVSQLKTWVSSNQRLAQETLPELISMLIKESVHNNAIKTHFPSGDSINSPGFDGVVEYYGDDISFVPNGKSYWELSTANSLKITAKIKSDFKKRTLSTSEEERRKATFVFVTTATLLTNKKTNLINLFNDNWKKVIIYDANDLEEWLSMCCTTAAGLYEKFEHKTLKFQALEVAYKDLITCTSPKLSPNLFIVGRENNQKLFLQLLEQSPVIKVSSSSRLDSLSFVLSTIIEKANKNLQAKVIVLKDNDSLDRINRLVENKILICDFPLLSYSFPENNKFIFLFGKNPGDEKIDIELEDRISSSLYLVLKNDMHISYEKLIKIYHKAKNNISFIIRELERKSTHFSNNWRNDEKLSQLIPILLIGEIDIENRESKDLLSNLLPNNTSLDDYIQNLSYWKKIDNSPLVFGNGFNEMIKVDLKEELWENLHNFITSSSIKNVLSYLKEKFINVNFDNSSLSNDKLICNLLDSCVLATIYNCNAQLFVDSFIFEVFNNISTEAALRNISKFLIQLAECSPNAFFECVNKDINAENSLIIKLFEDKENESFYYESDSYLYFLRALELLTNLKEKNYFVCDVLIKLKNKHLKVEKVNDFLIAILHSKNNKTALTLNQKKELVLHLLDEYKTDFFDVVLGLINEYQNLHTYTKFKWRTQDYVESNPDHFESKFYNVTEEYVNKILTILEPSNAEIIKKLFENHCYLTTQTLNDITTFIKNNYKSDDSNANELYDFFVLQRYDIIKYQLGNKDFLKMCEDLIDFLKPSDLLKSNLIYFKYLEIDYRCPIVEAIDNDINKENEKKFNYLSNLFKTLSEKYNHDILFETIISILPEYTSSSKFFAKQKLSTKDKSLFIKVAEKMKKYTFLCSFIVNLGKTEYDKYMENQSQEFIETLIPYISNLPMVPNIIYRNQHLTKLFFEQRTVNINDTHDETENLMIYNPMEYIKWGLVKYHNNFYNWSVSNIITALKNVDENKINNANIYNLMKVLSLLNEYYENEEILYLDFKFLKFSHEKTLFSAINKYFFNNPNKYIDFVLSKKQSYESYYKVIMYMSFPSGFENEKAKMNNFINTIMNYNDSIDENKHLLRNNLGNILIRSFNYDKEHFLPNELKDIIERLRDHYVNWGIIIGFENMNEIQQITNGEPKTVLAEKLNKEKEKICCTYPFSAKILSNLAKNATGESNNDKQDFLLEMSSL